MCNKELSEKDKVILQGRIYPAIQSCVNNRYKIILGLFAYYGYILGSENALNTLKEFGGNWICSLILTGFVIHNLINYWSNRNDQLKREPANEKILYKKWPWTEISFSIITFILIILAYLFFGVKRGIW